MAHRREAAKAALTNIVSKGAARLPIDWLRSFHSSSLIVPYYHMVSDAFVPHVSHLYRFRTIAEFRSDLEFFLRHFEPVSLSDIVEALNGARSLTRPCFHLTFDDGFREMHDIVAPILQRFGVPATFFLNTAFLDGGGLAHHNVLSLLLDRLESGHVATDRETIHRVDCLFGVGASNRSSLRSRILSLRYADKALVLSLAKILDVDLNRYIRESKPYLSSEQVCKLLDWGFSIGGHSHDHPLYADLPLSEQLAQTQLSMQLLKKRFRMKPNAFAFPHSEQGVGDEFFATVFSESLLEVTFGTGGLVPHFHPRNIKRVAMEKTSAPAAQILAKQFVRALYFRLQPGYDRSRTKRADSGIPKSAQANSPLSANSLPCSATDY